MKNRSIIHYIPVSLLLFTLSCTHPMRRGEHMTGYGWYGGIFIWLILILVAAFVIYLILQSRKDGGSIDVQQGTAADILKKRYARGEITREEFERIKKEIEG